MYSAQLLDHFQNPRNAGDVAGANATAEIENPSCGDVVPAVAHGSRIILADSWTADTAEIAAARPDLVIAAVPYQEKAVSEILKAGARFLGLAPRNLADIYTDIATIAGAVGAMGH